MGDRKFITRPKAEEYPFPWVVVSHRNHNAYEKPHLVESWPSKESALHCGRVRHDEGLVVKVYREVAFTVGTA